jgi:hypothetical protein
VKTCHTSCSGPFNSTPFSSCCGVASMGSVCDRCGATVTHHVDSPAVAQAKRLHSAGRCGICGARRGNPAVAGNCHC